VLLLSAESLLLGGGGAALGVKISQTEEGSDDTHTHWLLSLAFNALGNECTHTLYLSRARFGSSCAPLIYILVSSDELPWFDAVAAASCRLFAFPRAMLLRPLEQRTLFLSSSSSLCNQNTHRTPLIIIYTCAQRQSHREICGHACSDERAPVRCYVVLCSGIES
jgi:hypothetical protein